MSVRTLKTAVLSPTLWRTALLLALASPAVAQTGVSDDRVSLPEGPGSLEGVGDNAEIDPNMGAMNFSVAIEVPEGFAGVTPQLALNYSSAAGAGLTGIGWDMAVPFIERMTRFRLPAYTADDDIVANGGLQLIEVANSASFAEYRARFEEGFVRYRWHGRAGGAEGYWTSETPDGVLRTYGANEQGRLDETTLFRGRGDGVFRWHLKSVEDPFGHRAEYDYVTLGGLPYLDRIQYIFTAGAPSAEINFEYEAREDRLSDARSGRNELRTHRLSAINVVSKGTRIGRYVLTYEPYAHSGGLSRLARVDRSGVGDEPHPIAFSFEYSRTLGAVCDAGCEDPYLVNMGSIGVNLGSGEATLADMNGDALPDIVDSAQPGAHRIFINEFNGRDNHRFGPVQRSARGTQAGHQLSSPYVQTLDVNGDGRSDVVNVQTGQVLYNNGSGDWAAQEALRSVGPLPNFGEDFAVGAEELTHIRFFDFDNDRRIDVLRSTDVTTSIYENLGAQGFALANGVESIGAGFSDQRLEMADMNGDGLLDPVIIRVGEISYRLNLGLGRWSAWRDIINLPINNAQIEFVELEDINGDSLDDIVIVVADSLSYALNRGGDRFDEVQTVRQAGGQALPQRVDGTTVLYADMNGSGSDDVVWITAAGEVTYLELFPLRPNLLTRIENGLGLITEISYQTSVEQLAAADGPWAYTLPFPMIMAASIDVYDTLNEVHQVSQYTYRDAFYDTEEKTLRGYAEVDIKREGDESQDGAFERRRYDVGVQDRYRAGKLLAMETWALEGEDPEANIPLVTERNEWADCPLQAGLPETVRFVCQTQTERLVQEGRPASEHVTQQQRFTYDRFGNVIEQANLGVTAIGGGACGTCDRPEGVYGAACGPDCRGDELYTLAEYAEPSDAGRWFLRLPVWSRTTADPDTGHYTETQSFYDGDAFVGLPAGQFAEGRLMRQTTRVDERTAFDSVRNRYDAHGNVIETLGPRGAPEAPGHRRRLTYDDEHLLITEEAVELLDAEGNPYQLRRQYTYDPLWGELATATDQVVVQGGQPLTTPAISQYTYDALGRLATVAEPGDSPQRPTTEWIYEPGNIVSRVIGRQRSQAGANLPDTERVECFDGFGRKVQTRTRLASGEYEVDRFAVFNRRGEVVRSHRPYRGANSECDQTAPDSLPVSSRLDALGRAIGDVYPDETLYGSASTSENVWRPLEELRFGLHDTDAESPYADTPMRRLYDGQDRLVLLEYVHTPGSPGDAWRMGYDVYGNLSTIIDPQGHVRTQIYDAAGRVIEVMDPDRGTLRFTVDEDGNVIRREDDAGRVQEASFDALNRATARWDAEDAEATLITHIYDLPGLCDGECDHTGGQAVLTTMPRGRVSFRYDHRHQMTEEITTLDGVTFSQRTTYDNLGRRDGAVLPDGTELSFTLDALGRVTGVEGFVDEVRWDRASLVESIALPNGLTERWGYDILDRPTVLHTGGEGDAVVDLTWTLDRDGQVVEVLDGAVADGHPGLGAEYVYDSRDRLITAHLEADRADFAEQIDFEYDAIDNLIARTSSRGPGSPAHLGEMRYGENAGPHALTSVSETTLTYDAAGFVASRGDLALSWDAFGRLKAAQRGDDPVLQVTPGAGADRVIVEEGAGFSFQVSPDFEIEDGLAVTSVRIGERVVAVQRTDALMATVLTDVAPAGGEAELSLDPDGIIEAADAVVAWRAIEGQITVDIGDREISPARRLLKASVERALLGGEAHVVFHHRERGGDLVAVTDAEGEVIERPRFFPFGGSRVATESFRAFNNKHTDGSTGLVFFGARYYDPALGRWMSPDPAFDTLTQAFGGDRPREATNSYVYSFNNPVMFEDLDGHQGMFKGVSSFFSRTFRRSRSSTGGASQGLPISLAGAGGFFVEVSRLATEHNRASRDLRAARSALSDAIVERGKVQDAAASGVASSSATRYVRKMQQGVETAESAVDIVLFDLATTKPRGAGSGALLNPLDALESSPSVAAQAKRTGRGAGKPGAYTVSKKRRVSKATLKRQRKAARKGAKRGKRGKRGKSGKSKGK